MLVITVILYTWTLCWDDFHISIVMVWQYFLVLRLPCTSCTCSGCRFMLDLFKYIDFFRSVDIGINYLDDCAILLVGWISFWWLQIEMMAKFWVVCFFLMYGLNCCNNWIFFMMVGVWLQGILKSKFEKRIRETHIFSAWIITSNVGRLISSLQSNIECCCRWIIVHPIWKQFRSYYLKSTYLNIQWCATNWILLTLI
jgi:hypothetical protein